MKSKSQKRREEVQSQSPVPKDAGTTKLQLGFSAAISAVIGGKKIRRVEWADQEEYCLLKESFLMIHRNDKFYTWIVSEGDLLSIDWEIIK